MSSIEVLSKRSDSGLGALSGRAGRAADQVFSIEFAKEVTALANRYCVQPGDSDRAIQLALAERETLDHEAASPTSIASLERVLPEVARWRFSGQNESWPVAVRALTDQLLIQRGLREYIQSYRPESHSVVATHIRDRIPNVAAAYFILDPSDPASLNLLCTDLQNDELVVRFSLPIVEALNRARDSQSEAQKALSLYARKHQLKTLFSPFTEAVPLALNGQRTY